MKKEFITSNGRKGCPVILIKSNVWTFMENKENTKDVLLLLGATALYYLFLEQYVISRENKKPQQEITEDIPCSVVETKIKKK